MSPIGQAEALQLLREFKRVPANPRADKTLEALVQGGHCFELTSGAQARAVYILKAKGDQIWIEAAYGAGDVDWTALGLPLIERQARAAGAASIAFETRRPGLVRKSARRGYQVAAYVVRKDLQHVG
jgi:hypothetical protein